MSESIKLLAIDLFCGAGGVTTGIEQATDENGNKIAKVIACVNHDQLAIESHKANHPHALHFVEDIRDLNLDKLLNHLQSEKKKYPNAKVIIWAYLECTHFSKAKGGDARCPDSRSLAWDLVRYIQFLNPDFVGIENVEEFMSWGPMAQRKNRKNQFQVWKGKTKEFIDLPFNGNESYYNENGFRPALYPEKRKNGKYYLQWIKAVKELGYNYDFQVLNCANYGAYTSRKRFFGFFATKDLNLSFPKATHSKNPTKDIFGELKKWKPVKEVLDFSDEGNSIFDRELNGKRPLSEKTLERIYAGLLKHIAGGEKSFLSKYYSGNPDSKNITVNAPAHTVTTSDHHSLVQPNWIVKYLSNSPKTGINKGFDVNQPCHTVTTHGRMALASCKFLVTYNGKGESYSLERPAVTITTKDRMANISCNKIEQPITPSFLDMQYGNGTPSSIERPANTVTTNDKHNLVQPKYFIVNPQFQNKGASIEKPCFTLIARMDKRPPSLVSSDYIETINELDSDWRYIINPQTPDDEPIFVVKVLENDSDIMVKIKEFMAIFGIYDIKMRMLRVRELKAITGFPKDYILKGSKAKQKHFIGNAVPVLMAQRLIEHLIKVN